MDMSKAAIELKSQKVEEIKDMLSRAKSVVIVDYRGLTVSEDTQLRKEFRNAGVEYKVLKNTMVSRAAADLGIKDVDGMLQGPSAFAFGYDDPVTAAKVYSDFANKAKTEAKGGIMDNAVIDVSVIKKLSELPTRTCCLRRFSGRLKGSVRNLACALNAVKEQRKPEIIKYGGIKL